MSVGEQTPPVRSTEARPGRARPVGRWTVNVVLVTAFLWAALGVDVDLSRLLEAPGALWRIALEMFSPPDLAYVGRAMEGMIESVQIAWIGTLIAAACSLPLSLAAARNIAEPGSTNHAIGRLRRTENVTSRTTSVVVRQLLNAIRAVPELVLAIAFIPVVGLGAFAGTLAIGLHSIGTLGKLSSEAVEGIMRGPVEAAEAVGATRSGVMRWGVLPQVLPEIVAFWLYRFEINLRTSAILGVVGAGGVGGVLQNTITYRRWDKAGMTIIVIVVATIAIDIVSTAIRRRIIAGGPTSTGVSEALPPGEVTA